MSDLELGPSGELVEVKAAVPAMGVDTWLGGIYRGETLPGGWQRGVTIECTQNLFRFSSVYACIALISDDVAKLTPRLQREADDGIWDKVDEKSPFLPLLRKPNRNQTWVQFAQQWVAQKLIHGNAYVYLERDGRGGEGMGVPRAMWVLDSRKVMPYEAPDGEVYYRHGDDIFDRTDIIHDRMTPIWHPLIGISPLYASGIAATVGLRIQANSENFFANMSRPSGQLTAPGKISTELAARLKAQFEAGFSGANAGRIFVSGEDLKYEPIPPIAAHDSQLKDQFQLSVEDVARAFKVPLYKISAGEYPALASIAAINQDYYDHAIAIHLEGMEQGLNDALGLHRLGLRIDIDEAGILRMDAMSRAEVIDKKVKSSVVAPNEARAEDNRHGVKGGESPLAQEQYHSLAALAKRDAKEDPFAKDKPAPAAPRPPTPTPEPQDDESKVAVDLYALSARFSRGNPCPNSPKP